MSTPSTEVRVMRNGNLSRIAAKHVNVMDAVEPAPHTPVPGAFSIVRVAPIPEEIAFVREQTRPVGSFWDEFNDLTLGSLAGTGK